MSHGEAARNPGHDGSTPSRPDERPRPQYGEYAPEGWTWQPPADAPAASEPPAAAAAPTDAAGRGPGPASRPADRVVSIALLVLGAFGAWNTAASLQQLPQQFQLVYDQQGIGEFTPPEWLPTLTLIGTVVQLALYAVVLYLTIRRLRAGRLAFWVPLAGGAASVVVMMVLVSIVFLNDPTFLSYVDSLAAAD